MRARVRPARDAVAEGNDGPSTATSTTFAGSTDRRAGADAREPLSLSWTRRERQATVRLLLRGKTSSVDGQPRARRLLLPESLSHATVRRRRGCSPRGQRRRWPLGRRCGRSPMRSSALGPYLRRKDSRARSAATNSAGASPRAAKSKGRSRRRASSRRPSRTVRRSRLRPVVG